jgi:hypothetical protein
MIDKEMPHLENNLRGLTEVTMHAIKSNSHELLNIEKLKKLLLMKFDHIILFMELLASNDL